MAVRDAFQNIDRRSLLISGGVEVGLLVAWGVWPRDYAPNLTAAKGETIFGAWLKIGTDGHVTVAVPHSPGTQLGEPRTTKICRGRHAQVGITPILISGRLWTVPIRSTDVGVFWRGSTYA